MPPSNKAFDAFDRSQKPLAFVSVNGVLDVLLMRHQLQVFQSVVRTVKIFVVDFQTSWNRTVKCLPYQAMDATSDVHAVTAQVCKSVMFKKRCFHGAIARFTDPCFSLLDRVRSSYTGLKKICNFTKGGALTKHLFGFGYFGRVQFFPPRNSTHISCVAHLVQIFKAKNGFPRFHTIPPFNVNRSIA